MIYEFDGKRPLIDEKAYVSDSAVIIGDVTIGADCYIGPYAVIRADNGRPVVIGEGSAIEDCAVLHTGRAGCFIGKRVTVGHSAIVHGDVLEDGANIGMGAIVSQDSEIGEYAVVAEGAVVKRGQKVAARTVVGGAPAKVLRELLDRDIEAWERTKDVYIQLARSCLAGKLKRID